MADAHALNREMTELLAEAGVRLGFNVQTEYALPGGRLDVVWTNEVPLWPHPLPIVGFEIESSWRTRKHIKGDLLNLADAGVSLGVIVLAGETEKDDGLRRFTEGLVNRPGAPILVWTRQDVYGLAGGDVPTSLPVESESADGTAEVRASPSAQGAVRPETATHAGKYESLWRWLRAQERPEVRATFAEVERVLGFQLPNSARNHVAHWHGYEGSAVARAIADAGWKASQVNLTAQTVVFVRS